MAADDGRRLDVIHDVVTFEVSPTPQILRDCVVNLFPKVACAASDEDASIAHLDAEVSTDLEL